MEKDPDRIARRVTHDELKAAEDAFQGRPMNEAFSWAAGRVYVGILVAKNKLNHERSAGRDVNDHRPKAWLELSHPQSVLVAGLLSLAGMCWLLWHVLQPGP